MEEPLEDVAHVCGVEVVEGEEGKGRWRVDWGVGHGHKYALRGGGWGG